MTDAPRPDVLAELTMALADADARPLPGALRSRLVGAALSHRSPGHGLSVPEVLDGRSVFGRAVDQMARLLEGLAPPEWSLPAIRGLDVQALVGHLLGVERHFADVVEHGATEDGADHVTSTQPDAEAQHGLTPQETLAQWREATTRSLAVTGRAPDGPVAFYGIVLPLDRLLVVRAFEIWIHHEDIRAATGRPPEAPPPAVLARMVELASGLLPAALAPRGPGRADGDGAVVRLVLTGPGGGTWDVPLDGTSPTRAGVVATPATARVAVDAADFCRVVGNRARIEVLDVDVGGDVAQVRELFAAAATLALD